ncbi:MAG: SIMPL domain-containing protein [Candidatus Paceibacterota bacterium]
MPSNLSFLQKTMLVMATIVLVIFASQWLPINWGSLELAPTATVTVTGQADGQQTNQIASFTAGVTANDADKETATQTVNKQMEQLIADLKEFGIADKDLRTDQVSVYEYQKPEPEILLMRDSMPPSPPRDGTPMWQASNTLNITLRDIDRASELATLLIDSGATNVYGPNFTADDTTDLDHQLLTEAMEDARAKAELLLSSTDQQIKRVISISETGESSPFLLPMTGGGVRSEYSIDAPIEPGSRTLYKSITVVFEIDR